MAKIWTVLVAVIIIFTALAGETAGKVTIDNKVIDRFIEEEMKISRIPGLALGIVHNGEPVYKRLRHGRPEQSGGNTGRDYVGILLFMKSWKLVNEG